MIQYWFSAVFILASTDWERLRNVKDLTTLPDSLTHLLSSPARYAHALNLSITEMEMEEQRYGKMTRDFFDQLQYTSDGNEKHRKLCQFRYEHGRHPFVCRKCWSYRPICLCDLIQKERRTAPIDNVVLWTHHDEYGRTSNTGVVLRETLHNCKMLLKGLPEHDIEMEALLQNQETNVVLLWPQNEKGGGEHFQYLSSEEMSALGNITLVALEGTWRNARRMLQRLRYVKRFNVCNENSQPSILAPLRAQGSQGKKDNMCTAEAVLKALNHVGMKVQDSDAILKITQRKIILTTKYRGKSIAPPIRD